MEIIKKFLLDLKSTFLSKSFLTFCALGTVNCLTNSTFSALFSKFLQKNIAAIFGYIISLSIAFLLSSRFIFKTEPSFKKYFRFLISYIPNFIIFTLIIFATINTWKLPQFWGTFIAAVAGGPITYVIIKMYAFGNK